jgi:RNA polymerase sigma-70 factor, ECF subfamily
MRCLFLVVLYAGVENKDATVRRECVGASTARRTRRIAKEITAQCIRMCDARVWTCIDPCRCVRQSALASLLCKVLPMPDLSFTPTIENDDPAAAWLADIASGSRTAFDALYRATSAKLFGICLHFLPDRSEAEDLLQEVYTNVWRKAAQFDAERASAGAWLAMIARNKAIDRLRTSPAKHRHRPIEDAAEMPDSGPSPLQHAEASADHAQLDACMGKLDAHRRTLIRTAFFEGVTYETLAERSGSPLSTMKSWIRRGLMQLRECLEA